jgi:hypothetical protein
MVIKGNGNVGIGTTSPDAKLEISDATNDNLRIGTRGGNINLFSVTDAGAGSPLAFEGSQFNFITGNVGIGTTNPVGNLFVGPTWSQTGGNNLYIKSQTTTTSYDPSVNATQDLGITYNTSSTATTGPDKTGLVLHNDAGVAGQFSPMIIFSGKEATPSQYKAAMAGIYARSPLGTGNLNDYIDGELIFATAGAATKGIVQRMVINKEGLVGIGTASPQSKLQVAGGIQMADDSDAAAAAKVGTMRYRTGTEYVEVTGADLIANGDFAADTSWTKQTGWTISGGTANGAATTGAIYQGLSASTISTAYKLTYTISGLTAGSVRISLRASVTTTQTTNGTFTEVFTSGTSGDANFYIDAIASFTGSIDNVSLIEVTEEDASYADMCMQTGASTYEWVNIVRNTY